ncbi:MAG TPA: ABC transporter permease, partial [Pirellulales bacterium]
MTRALLWRLAWKEYRAIRAFWISLLGLVVLAELLVMQFSARGVWSINLIYMIALAAPAFFALGCAGTAFSMEREEGTYEQMRAAPVEAWQLLVSKLSVTLLATAAMFAVAWPIALVASGRTLPPAETLSGMVEMWLAAAVEAIAWGTFFSLLSARPLISVLLALFVSSTTAHVSSWMVANGVHAFEAKYYVQAVPLRLLIAGSVLAIDIYLGLRWLDEHDQKRRWLASRFRRARPKAQLQTIDESLPRQPERGAMIAHLLWQQWRQSRGAMLLLVVAQLMVSVFIFLVTQTKDYLAPFALAPFWGAVAGALAFRPDQERNHFRFFVEHNIPPRWVWLTRQAPWLLAMMAAALLQFVAMGVVLLFVRRHVLSALQYTPGHSLWIILALPFAWVIGYTVGQWMSMFVKSGLMAGFLALVLTGVLVGWSAITTAMAYSAAWTVLPIVIAVVASTWLRSPDWIAENTTWRARIQAAAVVLLPT